MLKSSELAEFILKTVVKTNHPAVVKPNDFNYSFETIRQQLRWGKAKFPDTTIGFNYNYTKNEIITYTGNQFATDLTKSVLINKEFISNNIELVPLRQEEKLSVKKSSTTSGVLNVPFTFELKSTHLPSILYLLKERLYEVVEIEGIDPEMLKSTIASSIDLSDFIIKPYAKGTVII